MKKQRLNRCCHPAKSFQTFFLNQNRDQKDSKIHSKHEWFQLFEGKVFLFGFFVLIKFSRFSKVILRLRSKQWYIGHFHFWVSILSIKLKCVSILIKWFGTSIKAFWCQVLLGKIKYQLNTLPNPTGMKKKPHEDWWLWLVVTLDPNLYGYQKHNKKHVAVLRPTALLLFHQLVFKSMQS